MKVIIADIDSLVDRTGKLTGHYEAVMRDYQQIFGADLFVAGGSVYSKWENWLPLPYNAKKEGSRVINKLCNLINIRALFIHSGGMPVIFQAQAIATILLGLLMFGRSNQHKIFMIQYSPLRSGLCRLLWRLVKNKVSGVICTNKKIGEGLGVPYCVITDYIYNKAKYNKGVFVKEEYDFVTTGIIWPDKGVEEAIEVIGSRGYSYLVAGNPADEGIKERILEKAQKFPQVVIKFGYLSEDQYDKAIRSAKYTVLNYTSAYSVHSSGVIYDSLFRGRAIVGRTCAALSIVEEQSMGIIVPNLANVDFDDLMKVETISRFRNNINNYLKRNEKQADEIRNFLSQERK